MLAALDFSCVYRVSYINAYPYCLAEVPDRKIYGMLLSLKSVRQIVKLAELESKGGKAKCLSCFFQAELLS